MKLHAQRPALHAVYIYQLVYIPPGPFFNLDELWATKQRAPDPADRRRSRAAAGTVQGMFEGASAFNQGLSGWDASSAQSMEDMFLNANSLDACNKRTIEDALSGNDAWPYVWTDSKCLPPPSPPPSLPPLPPPSSPPAPPLPPPSPPPGWPFADRAELKAAVDKYDDDSAAAEAEYGAINTWNTSRVTDMSVRSICAFAPCAPRACPA